MIARNIILVFLTIGIGVAALVSFWICYFKGMFEDIQFQALLPFDEVDLRLIRPWESQAQKQERELIYGDLIDLPEKFWELKSE